ncbi:hypothetical protein [Streptomyces sp. NPDC004528]|uniref:hypothetical protein n=1 Tax=Streptomyces sp. NPDC004528 TaxID=3154550 RepID=UPI00339EE61A
MSAPAPRPPGAWRALARDACLNPEERAARDAVRALLPAKGVRGERPWTAAADLAPEQRLIRFQSLVDRAGWRPSFTFDDERARLEAFHPSRAAVMFTARFGRDRVNAYILRPADVGMPRWKSVGTTAVAHFLTHQTLPDGVRPHPVAKLCKCAKKGRFPTEEYAKIARTELQLRNRRNGLPAVEGRVYRCPHDQRIWHVTRRSHWNNTKTQKGAST